MQTSILRFAEARHAHTAEARAAQDAAKRERQETAAASLGLTLADLQHRAAKPGMPSRRERWFDLLRRAILADDLPLPAGLTLEPHIAWGGSMLVQSIPDSLLALGSEVKHEDVVDLDLPSFPKKARKKKCIVSNAGKELYFDYLYLGSRGMGWDKQDCLRFLKHTAPDIFKDVHPRSVYRWRLPSKYVWRRASGVARHG